MIEKLLDAYELKAKIFPGLVVALPILATATYALPVLGSWALFAASGICGLALLFAIGQVVSARGEAIEAALWDSWGGPPSTRYMRHRDTTFGAELKESIHGALIATFSVRLLSADEESKNAESADKAIADAFRQVRPYLREHDAGGLWFKHNIEYGFCRNLFACRGIWVLIAVCSLSVAIAYGVRTGVGALNVASVIDGLSLVAALYVGWYVLPHAPKRDGERYAESAWMAFLRASRH